MSVQVAGELLADLRLHLRFDLRHFEGSSIPQYCRPTYKYPQKYLRRVCPAAHNICNVWLGLCR